MVNNFFRILTKCGIIVIRRQERRNNLDIKFSNQKTANLFNSKNELIKKYGDRNAQIIMRRLNEFSSVDNLGQISHTPPPRRHHLIGQRQGQYAVDLKHPFRLVFVPVINENTTDDSNVNIDFAQVTSITILEVIDYHD
jgi:toxin HigB-1